jgi:hypothetical protein
LTGSIDFLGQVFNPEPISLSDALLEKAKYLIDVLNSVDLQTH